MKQVKLVCPQTIAFLSIKRPFQLAKKNIKFPLMMLPFSLVDIIDSPVTKLNTDLSKGKNLVIQQRSFNPDHRKQAK